MIKFFTRKRRRRGQGMTEYIVIVGLIAIVLIAAIKSYSQSVEDVIVGTDGMVDSTNAVNTDMNSAITANAGAGNGPAIDPNDPNANPNPNPTPNNSQPNMNPGG